MDLSHLRTLCADLQTSLLNTARLRHLFFALAAYAGIAFSATAQTLTNQWTDSLTGSYAGSTQLAPSIPVGWGYMDPMVAMIGSDQYAPLFHNCNVENEALVDEMNHVDDRPYRYCIYLVKNGDVVSNLVDMATFGLGTEPSPPNRRHAYQPPMLFAHDGKIFMAYWVYTPGTGSVIQLLKFDPANPPGWTVVSTYNSGSAGLNYLGGAMSAGGDIVIAGYSQTSGLQTLLAVKTSPPYTTWQTPQIVTQYTTVAHTPLYPHVAIKDDDKISILAVLHNGTSCGSNVWTAYKNVVVYEGYYGSPINALWSDASGDVVIDPNYAGDNCYYNAQRFPLDHFYDPASDAVYSIVRSQELTAGYDLSDSVQDKMAANAPYTRTFKLYKDGALIHGNLASLFSSYFADTNQGGTAIDSMSMTRLSNGEFVIFANSRGPGASGGSAWTWQNIGVTWSSDLSTFATPQYLTTSFGAGHAVKVAQPAKNGSGTISTLDFFTSGNLYNPSDIYHSHQYTYRHYTLN
ncbi:MAG TPA: hypothetical protein VGO52_01315 [Hyphomonadaceae bacterium]|jgi:hypothetical protein|nr:hypothetical protein [Hyphomonadaceae bacterium]